MPPEDTPTDIFEAIDDSLRAAYGALLNDDLPDRFLVLIQSLKEKDRSGGPASLGDGGGA